MEGGGFKYAMDSGLKRCKKEVFSPLSEKVLEGNEAADGVCPGVFFDRFDGDEGYEDVLVGLAAPGVIFREDAVHADGAKDLRDVGHGHLFVCEAVPVVLGGGIERVLPVVGVASCSATRTRRKSSFRPAPAPIPSKSRLPIPST